MDINQLQQQFEKIFGTDGNFKSFHAPGRVNLIGEHTDYNGGLVFPCALSLGTYGVARKRGDGLFRFASTNFPGEVIEADAPVFKEEYGWVNYPLGVVSEFEKLGHKTGGMDLLISGNLPNGAGLSSSASVELLVSTVLNTLFDCGIPTVELVKLSQRAENQFVGVNCGIMDQFASGMGKKDSAILLNCSNLDYQYVPLALGEYKLIIANTNKKRGLTDSKYNERRSECEQALNDIRKVIKVDNLCDLSIEEFETHKQAIKEPVARDRAAHAVYENARTKAAVYALSNNDLPAFGKMMNQSHVSLRDLYEVTGNELDALAEAAWNADGVLGSRMTGAGFGGCTVSIVHSGFVDNFIREVGEAYNKRTELTADFYIAETGDGAREI